MTSSRYSTLIASQKRLAIAAVYSRLFIDHRAQDGQWNKSITGTISSSR